MKQRKSGRRPKQEPISRETGARGEAFLQVGEETYPILFTNRAIFRAERVTGKPVLQMTSLIQDETLSMGDLVQMLLIGLEAGRRDAGVGMSATRQGTRPYALTDAWDIMDVAGFRAVLVAVFEALAAVLSYSPLEFDLPIDLEDDESPPGD